MLSQVFGLDPGLPISDLSTMDDLFSASLTGRRFHLALLGTFAGLALALAAVGIYGVVSFTTAQRTQEFGVRVALGAKPPDLLLMVLRDTMGRVVLGVLLGVAAAVSLSRLLEAWLFGVGSADVLTIASVVAALSAVALLSTLFPARRATRFDPVTALRAE